MTRSRGGKEGNIVRTMLQAVEKVTASVSLGAGTKDSFARQIRQNHQNLREGEVVAVSDYTRLGPPSKTLYIRKL